MNTHVRRLRPHARGRGWVLGLLGAGLMVTAHADDGPHTPRATPLPRYAQECGACHLAYPAGLLPASSWQRLMGRLPRHFGTDASLDAATLAELSAWLDSQAGRGRRSSATPPPDDRITRSSWFLREHRKVPAETWTRAAVRSPSNCSACHTQADQGDFDEDTVRIPR